MDIPKRFIINASVERRDKDKELFFNHFGIIPTLAPLYGNNVDDIVRVELEVTGTTLDNREENLNPDYWGYYDFGQKRLSLVYPNFISFQVCFPYGPKSEEDCGRGKCLNFDIVKVMPLDAKD